MNRLILAAPALIALCSPSHAYQCPQPVYASNQVCLNPEGNVIVVSPTERSLTFGMNGRTTDKDSPGYTAKPNVFWVVNGDFAIGNWGNPKFKFTEYSPGGVEKNTHLEATVDNTYGKQKPGNALYGDLQFFDINFQLMFNFTPLLSNMPCGAAGAQKATFGPIRTWGPWGAGICLSGSLGELRGARGLMRSR
jgi:hypothetical protein